MKKLVIVGIVLEILTIMVLIGFICDGSGYQRGQIDALKGIQHYHLKDSTFQYYQYVK